MRLSAFKVFAMLAALVVAGALLSNSLSQSACTLLNGADTLSIKLADLAPGMVRAFCYENRAGQKLRFLLARDSGGRVHGVFDACRQCYRFQKGYTWSHGYLICRLCGNRYRISDISKGLASCVPAPLAIKTTGDEVSIRVADVKAGKWLF